MILSNPEHGATFKRRRRNGGGWEAEEERREMRKSLVIFDKLIGSP